MIRERRRYIAVMIDSERAPSRGEFVKAIYGSLLRLYGEYGMSQANLQLIEYNSEKRYAIIRCSHKALDKVRASIAMTTKINDKPISLHIMHVSGTLKSLRRRIKLFHEKGENEGCVSPSAE